MIKVIYCETAPPLSDFRARYYFNNIEKFVELIKDNEVMETSSESYVDLVRLCVAKQLINCNDIEFKMDDEIIKIDKFGAYKYSFPKCGSIITDILEEILKTCLEREDIY